MELTNNQLIYWPTFIDLHLLIVNTIQSTKLALCILYFYFYLFIFFFFLEKFNQRYTKLFFLISMCIELWRIINKKNVINKKCKLTSQKLVKNA